MIYLLFYKSSFTDQNKIFHTFLFGTLLYMVIHMVMTFLDSGSLNIIKNNYFKLFVTLDLISAMYIAYGDGQFNLDGNTPIVSDDKEEDINKTIDKLKNKINNIAGVNRNNEPVISFSSGNGDIDPHPKLQPSMPPNIIKSKPKNPSVNTSSTPISEISMGHHPSQIQGQVVGQPKKKLDETKFPPINDPIQQELDNLAKSIGQSQGSQSTPINNLGGGGSTSIIDLKGDRGEQPNIGEQFSGAQSDTLSDIGSNLDLDLNEFENSL